MENKHADKRTKLIFIFPINIQDKYRFFQLFMNSDSSNKSENIFDLDLPSLVIQIYKKNCRHSERPLKCFFNTKRK